MANGRSLHRTTYPDIAEIGALIGDPGRAAMLLALLDGRDVPASELAARANVTPQAASAHLKKLLAAGLLRGRASGRHRLFSLASAEVAHAIEALATIAQPARIVALSQSTQFDRLRAARSCYDHLAGRLGVALTDWLVREGAIAPAGAHFTLDRAAERIFGDLRVDIAQARALHRAFARACLDWTERRAHLAGGLGAALLRCFLEHGWIVRNANDRAIAITPQGARELQRRFAIDAARLSSFV